MTLHLTSMRTGMTVYQGQVIDLSEYWVNEPLTNKALWGVYFCDVNPQLSLVRKCAMPSYASNLTVYFYEHERHSVSHRDVFQIRKLPCDNLSGS